MEWNPRIFSEQLCIFVRLWRGQNSRIALPVEKRMAMIYPRWMFLSAMLLLSTLTLVILLILVILLMGYLNRFV